MQNRILFPLKCCITILIISSLASATLYDDFKKNAVNKVYSDTFNRRVKGGFIQSFLTVPGDEHCKGYDKAQMSKKRAHHHMINSPAIFKKYHPELKEGHNIVYFYAWEGRCDYYTDKTQIIVTEYEDLKYFTKHVRPGFANGAFERFKVSSITKGSLGNDMLKVKFTNGQGYYFIRYGQVVVIITSELKNIERYVEYVDAAMTGRDIKPEDVEDTEDEEKFCYNKEEMEKLKNKNLMGRAYNRMLNVIGSGITCQETDGIEEGRKGLDDVVKTVIKMKAEGMTDKELAEYVVSTVKGRLSTPNHFLRSPWTWVRHNLISMYDNFNDWRDTNFEDCDTTSIWAWNNKMGQCEENACVVHYILSNAGVDAQLYGQAPGDHAFVVVNMDDKTSLTDSRKWKDNVFIADSWQGYVYSGNDAYDSRFLFRGGKEGISKAPDRQTNPMPLKDRGIYFDLKQKQWKCKPGYVRKYHAIPGARGTPSDYCIKKEDSS